MTGAADTESGSRPERGPCVRALPVRGPSLGLLPNARYPVEECQIESPAQLYVFSDGVYEITKPDGSLLGLPGLESWLVAEGGANGSGSLEAVLRFAREVRGGPVLEDDFSIVRMTI
jgi:serine phosphatase RsbU (regulator of sigma subunit)